MHYVCMEGSSRSPVRPQISRREKGTRQQTRQEGDCCVVTKITLHFTTMLLYSYAMPQGILIALPWKIRRDRFTPHCNIIKFIWWWMSYFARILLKWKSTIQYAMRDKTIQTREEIGEVPYRKSRVTKATKENSVKRIWLTQIWLKNMKNGNIGIIFKDFPDRHTNVNAQWNLHNN